MKKQKSMLITLALILLLLVQVLPADAQLKVGDKVPDFELEGIDDETYKLSDFTGKVVILHFWKAN